MADPILDDGLTTTQLWTSAWLLGAVSLICWLYLANHLSGEGSWDGPAVLGLAVAVSSSVFSAACVVLVAIKSSEVRIRRAASAPDRASLDSGAQGCVSGGPTWGDGPRWDRPHAS
jgi:hypothetical protein